MRQQRVGVIDAAVAAPLLKRPVRARGGGKGEGRFGIVGFPVVERARGIAPVAGRQVACIGFQLDGDLAFAKHFQCQRADPMFNRTGITAHSLRTADAALVAGRFTTIHRVDGYAADRGQQAGGTAAVVLHGSKQGIAFDGIGAGGIGRARCARGHHGVAQIDQGRTALATKRRSIRHDGTFDHGGGLTAIGVDRLPGIVGVTLEARGVAGKGDLVQSNRGRSAKTTVVDRPAVPVQAGRMVAGERRVPDGNIDAAALATGIQVNGAAARTDAGAQMRGVVDEGAALDDRCNLAGLAGRECIDRPAAVLCLVVAEYRVGDGRRDNAAQRLQAAVGVQCDRAAVVGVVVDEMKARQRR